LFCGSATFGQGEPNQTVLTSTGGVDIFIARYNPNGLLAWAKSAGGATNDQGLEITALSDNSIVVIGGFVKSATFGLGEPNQTVLTSPGGYDIFIARYNADGTLAWAKRTEGVSGYVEGLGITNLSDNSTVVTGGFGNSITFGPGEVNQTVLTSPGVFSLFIARYNSDGTLAWAKSAGGTSGNTRGYGVTTLSDNSIVVTGMLTESATFGPGEPNEAVLTSAGNNNTFVAHYNPDGALAWAKCVVGGSYNLGLGITTLSDNSIVVIGQIDGSATFGSGEANQTVLTSAESRDIFITRYNENGTLAWAKQAGGAHGFQYCNGITTLSDNSVVVTGLFGGGSATFGPGEPNETVLTSVGGSDMFIARYNPDGTLAWVKSAGGE
jgi:uncharacterized delta-60 repeat protein